MTEFNFEKGGEQYGRYYPALKPVEASIVASATPQYCTFFHYEPGNGTRYEVLFTSYKTKYGRQDVMTLVNMRKAMIIPSRMDMQSLGYMMEKLAISEGDCYALIPLINQFMEETGE